MKIFIILLLIYNSITLAHNEFYSTFGGHLIEIIYTGYNGDDIVVWQNESQIPLYVDNLVSAIPDGMDQQNVENQFNTAKNKWTSGTCLGFINVSNPYGGVEVFFSNNASLFGVGSDIAAVTPLTVQNDYFAADPTSSQTQFSATQIIFNASNYPTNRDFLWTTQYVLPDDDDYLNFQNIALHELGHLIGFAHCSQSGAAMYSPPTQIGDISQLWPGQPDIQCNASREKILFIKK